MEPAVTRETPFVVTHGRTGLRFGHFTPTATVRITSSLVRSRVIAELSDAQVRTLVAALSLLSPNGDVQVTAASVAAVLAVPEREAADRLQSVSKATPSLGPVLQARERGDGGTVYSPTVRLVSHELGRTYRTEDAAGRRRPARVASRQDVLAASRAAYARPRAEAERAVLEQLGHPPEEADLTPRGEAYRALVALGVPRDTALGLLNEHPLESVQRQLQWLPERGAKSPARFIVAAVREDYGEPFEPRRIGFRNDEATDEEQGKGETVNHQGAEGKEDDDAV